MKTKMHPHECNTHSTNLFNSEKQSMIFSYTIFPVMKINVEKILKLRENHCLVILSIHILKLGNFRVWHPPNAPGFHSHQLGGFSGGKQRRRAWICSLWRGAVCSGGWLLARSVSNGCKCGEWKTLKVSASIYKPTGGAVTARWISIGNWLSGGRLTLHLPVVDALHLGDSATTTQFPGWWQDSRATQDTFYNQDDLSIWEEVLDSRLGGSVPRVLRFFLRILRDNLGRISDWPSAWIYNST
jgi:hypothetical protein